MQQANMNRITNESLPPRENICLRNASKSPIRSRSNSFSTKPSDPSETVEFINVSVSTCRSLSHHRGRSRLSDFCRGPFYSARFTVSVPSIVFVGVEPGLNLRLYIGKKFRMTVDGLTCVIRVPYPCDTT